VRLPRRPKRHEAHNQADERGCEVRRCFGERPVLREVPCNAAHSLVYEIEGQQRVENFVGESATSERVG